LERKVVAKGLFSVQLGATRGNHRERDPEFSFACQRTDGRLAFHAVHGVYAFLVATQ
jgi:hypothetical protein